ncbi:MAG: hypothetical protein HQ519_01680 [Planctomycetes bacterium]|nr:hypothetical protein [Planctomycetota bacterium]
MIPGFDKYSFRRTSGQIGLVAESVEESRSGLNGDLKHSEIRTREELALAFAGFYYHPKLIEYDLKGNFGLEQRTVDTSGNLPSNQVDGQNLSYDLRAHFFKDNRYSGELYAYRSESLTRQSFFATSKSIISEYGANFGAREWWIPSILNLSHRRFEGLGLNQNFELRDTARLEGRRDGDRDQYHYLAEFNDVQLRTLGTPYQDLNLSGSTTQYFGSDKQHRLFSGLFFREQRGAAETANTNWNTSYIHGWTEDLTSQHDAQFSTFKREDNKSSTNSFSSGLTHQLFQSLTSNAGARWSHSDLGAGDLDAWGWNGGLTYTKLVPFGRLTIQSTLDTYFQDRGAIQGIANVVGETHVYSPGAPIFLSGLAVDHASVIVRDVTGVQIYIRGMDYFLVEVGSRTRVDIPVTSNILSGQSILVDYSYQPTPEQEVETTTQSTTVTLSITETADFSVGLSSAVQDLVSGFDDGTLEDSSRLFASARWYPIENATLGAEYESFDSQITPFARVRSYADYQKSFDETFKWQAAASVYRIRFDFDPEQEYGASASSKLMAYLGSAGQADLLAEIHRAKYRTDEGSGHILELGYQKQYRQTHFSVALRYLNEEFDIADDQSIFSLRFYVTRRF